MRFKMIACVLAVALLSAIGSRADDNAEKKEKSPKMAAQTTQAQAAIQKSAGYAVFSNKGVNLLLSAAHGSGMAVNSKTKQETFMKMVSAGAGLGFAVKDYRVIFVFANDEAFTKFLDSGWSGSGQADAAAKVGKSGEAYSGAAEVASGV
jgi:lipid-binding SYLF domain-containing protein